MDLIIVIMSQQKLAQRELGIIVDYLKCNDCRVCPVHLMWPAHPGLGGIRELRSQDFGLFDPYDYLTTQVDIGEGIPLLL